MKTGSFDCVFFDPMFDKPALYETGFSAVRRHADRTPLDETFIAEARRVARRWVVVKAAPQSTDLRRLRLRASAVQAQRGSSIWARTRWTNFTSTMDE